MSTKQIKGFTLAEMMVTLALTSIMITFCYMSFNYIQRLLNLFSQQSFFITQLNELKKRGNILTDLPGTIQKEEDNTIVFRSDSIINKLEFNEKYILLRHPGQADTFHLKAGKIDCSFEIFTNSLWQDRLVNTLSFDIYFQKQRFHLRFQKNYDAHTKLNLEKEN